MRLAICDVTVNGMSKNAMYGLGGSSAIATLPSLSSPASKSFTRLARFVEVNGRRKRSRWHWPDSLFTFLFYRGTSAWSLGLGVTHIPSTHTYCSL